MQPPSFLAILSQAKIYCSFDGRTFFQTIHLAAVEAWGTGPPSANFDDTLPPLATGIPKLQNDIFEIWCS